MNGVWDRHGKALVVGLIALLIAAGGGAYAAIGGKPTIVVCVHHHGGILYKAHRCAHGDDKLSWAKEGPRGPAGLRGPAGERGPQGVEGQRGPQGVPGPTLAASGGGDEPPTGPDASATSGATPLATPAEGGLFVMGQMQLGMNCPSGEFNCSFSVGLYVDGTPVPTSVQFYTVAKGTTETYALNLFGTLHGVAPGKHTVVIGWKSNSPNKAIWGYQAEAHTSAVLLGE